jgi:signal transduction histidine kinase
MSAIGTMAGMIPPGNGREETERQLLLLVEASGALLASPEESDVVEKVMSLAQRFVAADGYALWRQTSETTWTAIRTIGLSDSYSRVVDAAAMRRALPILSGEPQVIPDVENAPLFANRVKAYRQEGIRSLVTHPLRLHGSFSGTLVFYYRQMHHFTEQEIRIAGSLANLAAAALGTSDLYERQKTLRSLAETAAQRTALLADIGATLASSLDIDHALATIAEMTVPFFADWCGVSSIDESGAMRRLVLTHADPAQSDLAQQVTKLLPPAALVYARLATRFGRTQLIEDVSEQILAAHVRKPEQIELIRRLGIRSLICAPLMVRGRTLGVMAFATAQSNRHYTSGDLEFAKELARRQALAVDNARLFADVTRERERVQLVNRSLRSANEALRRANSDLEQFAYSASHDLQEPLRTVAVYSQLLERHLHGVLDAEASSFIQYTVAAAKRMEVLVRDLLSYVQATTVVGIQTAPVDVTGVLKDTLVNLQAAIEMSAATVVFEAMPAVPVPALHLRQLFMNLVGNAIKYRGENPPRVEISARNLGSHYEFAVADNGIGIDPQYASQVFGIFKRLHTSDSYSGTGIGLAICQKIVERHGGRIWVDSELGRGSTFRFTLPCQEQIS